MVTDAMSALGMGVDEAETMVDQMAKTASTTNTSVAQLGEGILTIVAEPDIHASGHLVRACADCVRCMDTSEKHGAGPGPAADRPCDGKFLAACFGRAEYLEQYETGGFADLERHQTGDWFSGSGDRHACGHAGFGACFHHFGTLDVHEADGIIAVDVAEKFGGVYRIKPEGKCG